MSIGRRSPLSVPARPSWLLMATLLLVSCGGEGDGDRQEIGAPSFAPALGVDLDAMERSPSGLHTQVVEEGFGAPATSGETIAVHYTGWLPDGTRFDSSEGSDPLPVVVGETPLIEGFTEGIEGIRPGESRLLVIPPDLGYGAAGAGGVIPPGATLVFRVARADGVDATREAAPVDSAAAAPGAR